MKELYFSGAGGLYPYLMGIGKFIQDNYNLDDIIFTGNSSSSYITMLLSLNIPFDTAYEEHGKIMKDISSCTFGPLYYYFDIAKKHLYDYFKNNTIDIKKIKNLYIQITNTKNSFNYNNWESIFINEWDNIEDLLNCMRSSSYIPIYGTSITNEFRGMKCIDGGVNYYLKKYSHSTCKYEKSKYIKTDMWRQIPYMWYLIYSNKEWNDKLYNLGYEDATKNKKELDDFFNN
jgi:hypothetical protein